MIYEHVLKITTTVVFIGDGQAFICSIYQRQLVHFVHFSLFVIFIEMRYMYYGRINRRNNRSVAMIN